MKLSTKDAQGYFRKPDPKSAGLLIYGEDGMQVAMRRKQVIDALIGPNGEAEMRLTRLQGADLRKDGALLSDAMRAQSFFPGPRVALVEDATDGLAPIFASALAEWQTDDAQVIVTAGQLTSKSALRKVFEGHRTARSVGLYDNPPESQEIDEMIAGAGLTRMSRDARNALAALSRTIDPGDFRQTIEKLGLYMASEAAEVSVEDVAACAPQSAEAELDTLLAIVAEGQTAQIADILRRLYAQGTNPVTLCIGAMRHFRILHKAASDPGGAAAGIERLRPPIYGDRRNAMTRHAGTWGRDRLEKALSLLIETDLQLRSASTAPQHALVERALIRLAMIGRQGRG